MANKENITENSIGNKDSFTGGMKTGSIIPRILKKRDTSDYRINKKNVHHKNYRNKLFSLTEEERYFIDAILAEVILAPSTPDFGNWDEVDSIFYDVNWSQLIYNTMDEANINIHEKVLKYEEFINDHLKEDLKKIHHELDGILSEVAEYVQLKNIIQTFQETELTKDVIKSKVDVGCNFYMQANITDASKIYINVGCGHFVEFTLGEAIIVIEKRISLLTKKSDILKNRSATTKAHIKLVLHGIQELVNIK